MMDIYITRKDAMRELAVALVLVMEFTKGLHTDDDDARILIEHTRERADDALDASARFTGIGGIEDVREHIQSQLDDFTIECGRDIVKADTIRFSEPVYDNRRKPPVYLGRRRVDADVLDAKLVGDKPVLTLQIIATKGTWPLKAGTETKRYIGNIINFGIKRMPWDHEDRRAELKSKTIKETTVSGFQKQASRMLGRYDALRSEEEKDWGDIEPPVRPGT